MATRVVLNGINELTAKLEGLRYEMKFKGGRAALRKAAQLIRDKARANALAINDPKTREVIAKNIIERWSARRYKATGDLMFRVGVLGGARSSSKDAARRERSRRIRGISSLSDLGELTGGGASNPGGDTYYWRFVEFGTEKSAAHPFLRPALENNIQGATDEFIRQYDKAIDRALRKADRKK